MERFPFLLVFSVIDKNSLLVYTRPNCKWDGEGGGEGARGVGGGWRGDALANVCSWYSGSPAQ